MDEWNDTQVIRHVEIKKLIELEYKKLLSSGVNPDHNNFYSGFEKGYIKGITNLSALEAHDREVAAKALEEAASKFADTVKGREVQEELRRMAAEKRGEK